MRWIIFGVACVFWVLLMLHLITNVQAQDPWKVPDDEYRMWKLEQENQQLQRELRIQKYQSQIYRIQLRQDQQLLERDLEAVERDAYKWNDEESDDGSDR